MSSPASHLDRRTLRRYLDDALEPSDARAVEAHLEDCDACAEMLDDLEPPLRLPAAGRDAGWDERRMRRAVRRTVLRTALNAVLLVAGFAVAGVLLLHFVWHPLAVDRGGRVTEAITTTVELAPLTIPGGQVEGITSEPDGLSRSIRLDVTRRVGGQEQPIGTYTARLGLLRLTGSLQTSDLPHDGGELDLDRLGDGAAVTVRLQLDEPQTVEAVDELAVDRTDVALEWVGFDTGGSVDAMLGYGACLEPPRIPDSGGLGGFGSSGVQRAPVAQAGGGASHALEQTRRAVDLLIASRFTPRTTPTGVPLDRLEEVATRLADDPMVSTVVLTGSSSAVADAAEELGADAVELLGIDFDLAPPQPCG